MLGIPAIRHVIESFMHFKLHIIPTPNSQSKREKIIYKEGLISLV